VPDEAKFSVLFASVFNLWVLCVHVTVSVDACHVILQMQEVISVMHSCAAPFGAVMLPDVRLFTLSVHSASTVDDTVPVLAAQLSAPEPPLNVLSATAIEMAAVPIPVLVVETLIVCVVQL
jgi:hypothetical protein